jgi:glycosyltransferase involved in cell wall biosynthesis
MKKKVLVIDEWVPYPLDCGKKIRTFNLLKNLATSFDITLMCYADSAEDYTTGMAQIGVRVVGVKDRRLKKWTLPFYARVGLNLFESVPFSTTYHVRPEFLTAIRRFIATENPDVIHCEWTNLVPLLEGADLRKVVIASHNIESDIWFRLSERTRNPLKKMIAHNQAVKIEKLERDWYPRVACCTSVSKNDHAVIESYGGRSCVVENGVDVDYYQSIIPVDDGNIIAFTASYDTFSNQDAAHHFIDKSWRLVKQEVPDAILLFIGKCPTEKMKKAAATDPSIHLTGWVDDVRPCIARAKVCIVPLRIGGGSRLKIFEAMAMKKAIVSTRIGAEGIDGADGKDFILSDSPRDFSNAVVACLLDTSLREKLSGNAFRFVKDRYDWRALAEIQKDVWLNVVT